MAIQYVVKTLFGLEGLLAHEVQALGGKQVKVENRAVSCQGDLALGYRLNLETRTALSVLRPIKSGHAPTESKLYDLVRSVYWDRIFTLDKTFLIDMVCYSDRFRNTHFLALKSKDAIVDQFRDRYGKRPSISKDPDIKINIFIRDDWCTISLDTSGATLFKRGYRYKRGTAPINEVLAAGLLKLSGWKKGVPLVDPMCGSGTFLMEAAMMASKKAAQSFRSDFSFMKLTDYDEQMWRVVKEAARAKECSVETAMLGIDKDQRVLDAAQTNAMRAGYDSIKWRRGDFFKWKPTGPPGMIIFNPPYDERIGLDDAILFYKQIGDHLKQHCNGWKAWIISSHLKAIKQLGLRPIRRIPVFNGPLDCRFVGFDLY
ncbi:MAG: class I SAM-dependent RNA methyltransferase [Saprospiraceae bacterium]|nr:class I SAM-dependent RNA methyltransferase [Saprospiraceae bacterium]